MNPKDQPKINDTKIEVKKIPFKCPVCGGCGGTGFIVVDQEVKNG